MFFQRPVNKATGFTLLELLVALLLIGIILSYAVFSLGDGGENRRIKEEANRFYHLLKLAQEDAILNAREWQLEIDSQGYSFSIIHEGNAQAVSDPVFRPRQFAEYIRPVIQFEQVQFTLIKDDEKNDKGIEESSAVKIYLLSSGELTPFQIRFPTSDRNFEIKGSLQGEIIWKNLDRNDG